jgi:hypothetical protein
VSSIGVGVQAVLFTDYDIPMADEPHIFIPVQTAFRQFVRHHIYAIRDEHEPAAESNNNGNGNKEEMPPPPRLSPSHNQK